MDGTALEDYGLLTKLKLSLLIELLPQISTKALHMHIYTDMYPDSYTHMPDLVDMVSYTITHHKLKHLPYLWTLGSPPRLLDSPQEPLY